MNEIDGERITIGFKMEHRENKYKAESTFELYEGSILDELGEAFNTFLKQVGYIRKNDFIFMKDVSLEELDALDDYLTELRESEESS
jgi:hypothetical protein